MESNSNNNLKVLNKLNSITAFTEKPTMKFDDLEIGTKYKVYEVKVVNTRFGNKLLVETEMNTIFLPERFNVFDAGEINQLNILCRETLVMIKPDKYNLHFE